MVIRHRKRINKCQVAQRRGGARERGWAALAVIHVVAGCYKSSFRPPIGPNFSFISPFCDFSFLPPVVSLVSLSPQTTEPPVSAAFDALRKSAHTVALKIALRAERCIRSAFYFSFSFFFET